MPTSASMDNVLLQEAIADSRQDLAEVLYLLRDCLNRLKTFLKDVRKVKSNLNPVVYQETMTTIQVYQDAFDQRVRQVSDAISQIDRIAPSYTLLGHSEKVVQTTRDILRSFQTRIGALVTSTDWQSPSFVHAVRSQAGRQTNTIYATINDYKRDQHWDAYRYERAFLKEYIDALIKFPVQIYATSSGMAAFTTILNYLLLEHKETGSILMGKSVYFENKALISAAFGNRVIEINEADTGSVISAIKKHNPAIVFLDSITNAPDLPLPDIQAITRFLVGYAKQETYLVIDNTGLSVMFQPIPLFIGRLTNLRLIVFESLNKYHQFGMDRVTGGIIWSWGGDTGKLFDYRVHLGTIMPDILATSVPQPNRKILMKRLVRHERNALFLSHHLQEWINSHPESPLSHIVFPGLPNHPNYTPPEKHGYYGCYFMIAFKKKSQSVSAYKRFVALVIDMAKHQRVDLVSGTSFGLNGTRIYLTAVRSKPATPFIRVAAGTEHRLDLEKIKNVFLEAFSRFR